MPVYPLKGYSLTYHLATQSIAPKISVTDFAHKVVYARLGNRLRVAGMADLEGYSLEPDPERLATLRAETAAFLPKVAAGQGEVSEWTGLRPAMPRHTDHRAHAVSQPLAQYFNNDHLLKIGKRISDVLKDDDVDGVILTHGTDALHSLPKVDIVYAYGALEQEVIGTVAADARGLIIAGTGNGNIAARMVEPLRAAARDGLHVVRASRTGHGVVIRNGAQPDDDYGWLVVDDQAPQKARILLMLAISSHSDDRSALQAAFYRY